jgi:hypothetical protein
VILEGLKVSLAFPLLLQLQMPYISSALPAKNNLSRGARVDGATIGTGARPGEPSHWEEHGTLGRRCPGAPGAAKNCCGGLSFIVFEDFYFFFQGFIHLFY